MRGATLEIGGVPCNVCAARVQKRLEREPGGA